MTFSKRNTYVLLLILLSSCFAFPQHPSSITSIFIAAQPQSVSPKKQEPAELSGHVYAGDTLEPLKKAYLVLRISSDKHAQAYTAVTDAEGKYIIKNVTPGQYRLYCEHNGYLQQEYGQKKRGQAGEPLNIESGQRMTDADMRLAPASVITGSITDEDGDPIRHAWVYALKVTYSNGEKELGAASSAETDDRGIYRIIDLKPGRYFIEVEKSGFRVNNRGRDEVTDERYAPTFYPGGNDPSRAEEVPAPGGETQIDIAIQPVRTFKVSGTLVDTGHHPANGDVTLRLHNDSKVPWVVGTAELSSQGDGAFEIRGAIPGTYTIYGESSINNLRKVGSLDLSVGAVNVPNLAIHLQSAQEITGHIHAASAMRLKPAAVHISLDPLISMKLFSPVRPEKIEDDLSFTIKNVFDTEYVLNMQSAGEGVYVRSAQCGEIDLLAEPLRPGCGEINITLSANGAKLMGTLLDSEQKPIPEATIVLVPENQTRFISGQPAMTSTGKDGAFEIKGIRTGRYIALAFESMESGTAWDPEYIKRFIAQGKSIQISEGEKLTVELKLIPAKDEQELK